MKINRIAAQQLLDDLTKSKVVVTFSNDIIHTVLTKAKNPDETQEEYEKNKHSITVSFYPFTININNQFISSYNH